MTTSNPREPQSRTLFNLPWQVWAVVGAVLLTHIAVIGRHGYFRDELYYLACAEHLDWGYVDHPPVSVLLLKLATTLFGTSLPAVRIVGTLAACVTTVLYAKVAQKLGGNMASATWSALFGGFAPVLMVVSHLYSMNSLDVMLWAASLLALLSALEKKSLGSWAWLGLLCGLALENKLSAFWLLGAMFVAVLVSEHRRELLSWKFLATPVIAGLLFAPHLAWQWGHDSPTAEFAKNAATQKLLPVSAPVFLITQFMVTNPILAVLWILGLWHGWKSPKHRWLAAGFSSVLLLLLIIGRSRENYLSPAYIFVVPLGAMALADWLSHRQAARWAYYAATAVLIPATLCLALPILPPTLFIKLVGAIPVQPQPSERGEKSPMQGHADMFGWPEMAKSVREIWNGLPDDVRQKTLVIGANYGESSAIWFFNRSRSDMPVAGVHNNWWLWGPGSWDGESAILVGSFEPEILAMFEEVQPAAMMAHPYAVPEEARAPVTIARRLKVPVQEFWTACKRFH